MKTINLNKLLLLVFVAFLFSCNKNDNPLSENAKEGGLITVETGTVVYFINTMDQDYPVELKYYQGQGADITKIEVYKQFYTIDDTGGTINSDKTLFKTLDLSSNTTTPGYITYNSSFAELAAGTTIDGQLIPQADTLLKPGFYWELTYKIYLNDGRTLQVPNYSIFINSRFAGKYKVIDAQYWRINVPTYGIEDWPEEVTVTALNATTFKMEECEPFGNTVYFTIDDASGAIGILKKYNGDDILINGIPVANCSADPGAFNNAPCDGSNIAIKVASTKDTLKLTYGYITPTGAAGPREFWQVMVKI